MCKRSILTEKQSPEPEYDGILYCHARDRTSWGGSWVKRKTKLMGVWKLLIVRKVDSQSNWLVHHLLLSGASTSLCAVSLLHGIMSVAVVGLGNAQNSYSCLSKTLILVYPFCNLFR